MMKEFSGFVGFVNFKDFQGKAFGVNIDQIILVEDIGDGTWLYLSNNREKKLKESYEDVMEAIRYFSYQNNAIR